jgi:hypothetical protein
MRHGCDYYLSSVTPVAALRSEIANLGLNLALAQVDMARMVLANGASIFTRLRKKASPAYKAHGEFMNDESSCSHFRP